MKAMLYRLFDAMARVPQDKALHFIWCQMLALATFLAFGRDGWALLLSVLVTGTAAWAKEKLDKTTPGHQSSPYDLVAGILGGLPVWVLGAFIVWGGHA